MCSLVSTAPPGGSSLSRTQKITIFVTLPTKSICSVRDVNCPVQIDILRSRLELLSGLPADICTLHYPEGTKLGDGGRSFRTHIRDGTILRLCIRKKWEILCRDIYANNSESVYTAVESDNEHTTVNIDEAGKNEAVRQKKLFISIFLASHLGLKDICLNLVLNGSDMTGRTPFGHTVLHAAVSADNSEILEVLLTQGADSSTVNIYGHTPLETAILLVASQCIRKLKYHQFSRRFVTNTFDLKSVSAKELNNKTSDLRNCDIEVAKPPRSCLKVHIKLPEASMSTEDRSTRNYFRQTSAGTKKQEFAGTSKLCDSEDSQSIKTANKNQIASCSVFLNGNSSPDGGINNVQEFVVLQDKITSKYAKTLVKVERIPDPDTTKLENEQQPTVEEHESDEPQAGTDDHHLRTLREPLLSSDLECQPELTSPETQETLTARRYKKKRSSRSAAMQRPINHTQSYPPRPRTAIPWVSMKRRLRLVQRQQREEERKRGQNNVAFNQWLQRKNSEKRIDRVNVKEESDTDSDEAENSSAFNTWLDNKKKCIANMERHRRESPEFMAEKKNVIVTWGTSIDEKLKGEPVDNIDAYWKEIESISNSPEKLPSFQLTASGKFRHTEEYKKFESKRRALLTSAISYKEWLELKFHGQIFTRKLQTFNKKQKQTMMTDALKARTSSHIDYEKWTRVSKERQIEDKLKFESESKKKEEFESWKKLSLRKSHNIISHEDWCKRKGLQSTNSTNKKGSADRDTSLLNVTNNSTEGTTIS